MPELVDEFVDHDESWKTPALEMARDNPGRWVKCDGDHDKWTFDEWVSTDGIGGLPDGFEARRTSQVVPLGGPVGRVFVLVRWNSEPARSPDVPEDVLEAAFRVHHSRAYVSSWSKTMADYILEQAGEPDGT